MAADRRTSPRTARQAAAPPRGLRRLGAAARRRVAAIVIAAFGILDGAAMKREVAQWTREQAIPTVAVIAPQPGASEQAMVLPGTVQAWYEAPIYARVSGYLKNWYFDYGAHVKKGDVLAEIDAPDLDAQSGRDAGQAEFGAGAGQGPRGGKAIRRNRPTSAGGIRPRAWSRCRSRRASRPTYNSAHGAAQRRHAPTSRPTRARSTACRRWKVQAASPRRSTAS